MTVMLSISLMLDIDITVANIAVVLMPAKLAWLRAYHFREIIWPLTGEDGVRIPRSSYSGLDLRFISCTRKVSSINHRFFLTV